MISDVQLVVPAGDICGEGAVWDPQHGVLWWADINRFLVHRYAPQTNATESWLFDEPVVSVNLTRNPQLLLIVLATRIAFWSPSAHPQLTTIHRLPTAPAMRFNDAKVDPRGSLWVGTMRNNVGEQGEELDVQFAEGVLYRIDPDGTVTEWMGGIGISNTLAWSPDGSTFYFGDTIANAIYAFAFDRETGAASKRRPFLVGNELGLPDGSAMDAEGFLWNTRPLAGCLIRISPDGTIDRTVTLPILKPTTCAFGGADMRTLFITSARSAERLSGSLFSLRTEIPGEPIERFNSSTQSFGNR
jgi:sugar lactone lactonase YvrE